ncbi:DUF4326 domain-containing protein [Xanthomonas campestris pv. raphani]|uniref:DUF4326 domain-containing protein n=1 Tax=Xanthomonas campestris TaxID=339 RepID=UPI002B223286|nr:DUF4326 domain-containing protein [Xanthomonas campestris]MEA9886925.1 DUF4326 domain-containing protein [Xanthomonas campestris pv. raphani]
MSPLVFVDYSADFLCRRKFDRKVAHYTCSLVQPKFCATDDANLFLSEFCSERGYDLELGVMELNRLSHAIIFDSGSSSEIIESLRLLNVLAKVISTPLTTVVNRDKGEKFDIYIGRGTVWGNPYPIGRAGDREEVLRKYQYDFDRRLLDFFQDHDRNVAEIRGRVLGCHCKPSACHGDIIARYVNSLDDEG